MYIILLHSDHVPSSSSTNVSLQVERGAKVQAMVVVGTPGTVMDLIKRRQLDPSQIRLMCLDEADNMLDQQGLGDQCMRLRQ